MAKIKCRKNYKKKKVDELDNFAEGVDTGVYENDPPFILPPIARLVFQGLISTYDTKRSAYTNGGSAQKGPFLEAKTALIGGLDTLAKFVDEIADGNANTITLAGFEPTKGTSSASVKPAQPTGIDAQKGIALQIITTCPKITGVKYYGCIIVQGGPLPANISLTVDGKLVFDGGGGPMPQINGMAIDFTEQRIKTFSGLVHDAVYYVYYYCVNAAGVSPLSEPKTIICW